VPIVLKSGSVIHLEPSGPVRPVMGLLYLYIYALFQMRRDEYLEGINPSVYILLFTVPP
jgi:hypothetical protein